MVCTGPSLFTVKYIYGKIPMYFLGFTGGSGLIPKIIHFCWFGGKPLPELALHCIDSWKKYCPDYEIKRWDESNFDLSENSYVKEAYEAKKWAFITDYVRLKVLYDQGGVYMDTDVEVIGSLDPFLNDKAFSGFENGKDIPTGIMASEKGHPFFKELLDYYQDRHFILPNGDLDLQTNVITITRIASEHGFIPNNTKQDIAGMIFYPKDYFCPKDNKTGEVHRTENTVCIHHFNGSWRTSEETKLKKTAQKLNRKYGKFGTFLFLIYKYVLHPKRLIKRLRRK